MIMCSTLGKLCETYKVPSEYTKSSIDHHYSENTWEADEAIWGPYLKRDISSLSYIII